MEKLLKVVALSDEREFDATNNGKSVRVKAVDLHFSTKQAKTESGKTFLQQRVTLSDFGIIAVP